MEGGKPLLEDTNYRLAYDEARRLLAAADPDRVAARAGCRFDAEGSFFEVPFLGRVWCVTYPDGVAAPRDQRSPEQATPPGPGRQGAEPAPALVTSSILILHYLETARGVPVAGEWIAFRELPGGRIYEGPFASRTIRPLVARYGSRPARLVEAALRLGGRRENLGHAAALVPVFPRLPICFVLWEGDEEIPAAGQILFDRSAPAYLETEDLVVAAAEALRALRFCQESDAETW